jgi:glycosyltransferase 2 family protein
MTNSTQLTTPDEVPSPPPPSSSRDTWTMARLARGLLLFLVLTGAGLWLASRRGALGGGLGALRGVQSWAIVVGVLQALLDQLLGGLRIWACARAIGTRIALWPCTLANCANVFLGGVTPSQHAGGPAQIWILMRRGVRFTEAAVASFCAYLGTVGFYLALSLFVTLHRSSIAETGALQFFTRSTVIIFTVILGGAALALPRPDSVTSILQAGLRQIPFVGPRLVASAGVRGLERLLRDYSTLVHRALKRGKLSLLMAVGFSLLIYLNKFLVAYVIVRGLGLHPPLRQVLYLQSLQSLVTYFVPTPGASGVAEMTAAEFMRRVVPGASLGVFVVLWRTMSLYLGMTLGAATLLLSGFARRRAPVPRTEAGP